MENEFEMDSEELEFDGDDLGFDEFDEFEEAFEIEPVQLRTAIMSKDNMIALLCLKTADQGGAICRVDPRESRPAVQIYDNPDSAIEWFNKSLNTSRNNGWLIAYDGLPLYG